MLSVVGLEELRQQTLGVRSLPRIVRCGVAFPSYQVLQFAPFAKEPMSHDGLDFVFFLSVDHSRWWLVVVDPVLRSFLCIVSTMTHEDTLRMVQVGGCPIDKRQVTLRLVITKTAHDVLGTGLAHLIREG